MAKFDRIFQQTDVKKPEAHPRRETKWIHYTKLIDNAAQYCDAKDMEEIIALAGLIEADTEVIENVIVRKADTDEYEIIAGHKRRRACKYLVEEEGKKKYEFVPCTVKNISNVRAEFMVYSSNGHHPKSDYEKMHELERMKYLLETYPDEFPHLQTGRMVDRLAKQYSLSKTTVGEFLTIANNLSDSGRDKFEKGDLKKMAAVELAGLPPNEQEELLTKGITSHKEIKFFKDTKELGKEQEKSKKNDVPESKSYKECAAYKMYGSCKGCHYFMHSEACPYDRSQIGAYGKPILIHPADSLLTDDGCGTTSCFLCSMDCSIRLEKRWCVEAPTGNPFDCTTMHVLDNLEKEVGSGCQFINHDLAKHTSGDKLASPCCKECDDRNCGYRCNRSAQEQFEKNQETIQEADQLPGQLAVVNTEMEIAEDVPNFGTQSRNEEGQTLDCKDAAVEQPSSVPVQEPLTKEKSIEEEYPPKYFLDEQKERLNTMLYNQALGAIVPDKALERQKTIVCALANMVCELDNIALKEEMEQLPQPDLPLLKNNDQRKEFIESYKEWPVWIDQPLTGETYYRYVLNNKVSIVVKVSRKHVWQQYKETKEYEYAAEQYYLPGIKMTFSQNGTKIVEDESRTFYECSQNKSALVEFLKEYQKGNVSSGQ